MLANGRLLTVRGYGHFSAPNFLGLAVMRRHPQSSQSSPLESCRLLRKRRLVSECTMPLSDVCGRLETLALSVISIDGSIFASMRFCLALSSTETLYKRKLPRTPGTAFRSLNPQPCTWMQEKHPVPGKVKVEAITHAAISAKQHIHTIRKSKDTVMLFYFLQNMRDWRQAMNQQNDRPGTPATS
jgi:hypothetical protein